MHNIVTIVMFVFVRVCIYQGLWREDKGPVETLRGNIIALGGRSAYLRLKFYFKD